MEKIKSNRREFLASLSLGTGYLMFGGPMTACSRAANSTDPFQLVKLGDSGLKTTLLGMGTGVHGGQRNCNLTRQDLNKSRNAIQHAYDVGIRMFDCADTYGIHPLMSEALKTIPRDEITLTSKIWEREGGIPEDERPDADVVVERFRKELNTDYIDLVQMHCMVDEDWTDTYKRQMDILSDQKARGNIKAHGVSVHTLEAMEAALASDWVDVIHVRINPYGIAMDRPEPEQVIAVINKLHDSGKGVIGMKLIGGGKYVDDSEKIDNALKFVMGMSSVDMIIVGFESSEQIDDYSSRMKKALDFLSSA
jgi:aryl-alcohol dehydrogenase-like predicted oxidoreductase